MINRERIIRNYVNGYNLFDVNRMVADFADDILFLNIQDGKINLSIKGLQAFKQQAEIARSYFTIRQQNIRSFKHLENRTEIEVDYSAVLAMDFGDGLKCGQVLNLTGRSISEFGENKIIKLTDLS